MDIIRLIIGQLNSEEGESVPKRKALVNQGLLNLPFRKSTFGVYDAVAGWHADYSAMLLSWQAA
tara:strand:- start:746 stop:937 length:192 start_codon:yes stop_codon:yes gene_type:complete